MRLRVLPLDEDTFEPSLPDHSDEDGLHVCLERCLAELSPVERALITQFYAGTRAGEDKQNRKALAVQLRIPIEKLRKDAMKIRQRLERCIAACLERG